VGAHTMGFSPDPVKKGLARVLSRGKLLLHLERVPKRGKKAGGASLGSVELDSMVRGRSSPSPPHHLARLCASPRKSSMPQRRGPAAGLPHLISRN